MVVSVKQPPEFKKRKLSKLQQQKHNFRLGQKGEQQATNFLIAKNFKILDINIRYKNHEADIIALDRKYDEVVFFEVKTRKTDFYGDPAEAVDSKKIKSLAIIADRYIRRNKIKLNYRFDIISIVGDQIEHFENVTWI